MSDTSTDTLLIGWILAVPFAGAFLIMLAGRVHENLRETVTLVTAVILAALVWSLIPDLLSGERPSLYAFSLMDGLDIKFQIEPLGMMFATLASSLWIVNSIYSIGYMRGNNEKHQTRFYACFALSIAATIGVAFAGNLLTLFLFSPVLILA